MTTPTYTIGQRIYYRDNGPTDTGTIRSIHTDKHGTHSYYITWDDHTGNYNDEFHAYDLIEA